jgi:hypothetical protein
MRDVFLHLLKEEAASRNLAADPESSALPVYGPGSKRRNSDRLHSE